MKGVIMELNFKDRQSAALFNKFSDETKEKTDEEKYFLDEMMQDMEVEVSSSLDLDYLERIFLIRRKN